MRKIIFILFAVVIFTACQSSQNQSNGQNEQSKYHKVVVQEVLQTTNYTYLHVKEADSIIWLAVPTMQAQAGETYYYESAMRMPNFQSKELNRSFDAVYFLSGVSREPGGPKAQAQQVQSKQQDTQPVPAENDPAATATPQRSLAEPHDAPKAQVTQQKEIKVEPAKGGITIAQLYTKKESYNGKSVIVKGQVTKVNPGIMNHNWLHIQDGTSKGDKFDLTVTTTTIDAKVGDVVTLEGKITLNKDFGFGYFYDVIMEDAVQK